VQFIPSHVPLTAKYNSEDGIKIRRVLTKLQTKRRWLLFTAHAADKGPITVRLKTSIKSGSRSLATKRPVWRSTLITECDINQGRRQFMIRYHHVHTARPATASSQLRGSDDRVWYSERALSPPISFPAVPNANVRPPIKCTVPVYIMGQKRD